MSNVLLTFSSLNVAISPKRLVVEKTFSCPEDAPAATVPLELQRRCIYCNSYWHCNPAPCVIYVRTFLSCLHRDFDPT